MRSVKKDVGKTITISGIAYMLTNACKDLTSPCLCAQCPFLPGVGCDEVEQSDWIEVLEEMVKEELVK